MNDIGVDVHEHVERALPIAPDGYIPTEVGCPPTRPSVRAAKSLSQNETQWLHRRRPKAIAAMKDFFGHVQIPNFDAPAYIDKISSNSTTNAPNIGIAVSGGGYRALLNGGGALEAFDKRTFNATSLGHLGGLLQSSTYLTGLSGGSWLVGSMYMNNFSSVSELQTHGNARIWQFSNTVFEGPTSGIDIINTVQYWHELINAVQGKADAGYPVTLTDYW